MPVFCLFCFTFSSVQTEAKSEEPARPNAVRLKHRRQEDNRSSYRARLTEAVKAQLNVFAVDCGQLRKQVGSAGRFA